LGIGPACTIIGDRVCVLKGVEVPYVLRPADESFWFMGECYIDDIMRGELFQEVGTERSDLTMLKFEVRSVRLNPLLILNDRFYILFLNK
jgi:hypothetical protein